MLGDACPYQFQQSQALLKVKEMTMKILMKYYTLKMARTGNSLLLTNGMFMC